MKTVHQLVKANSGRDDFRVLGIFWKCARVGERLSPYVSLCCIIMAVSRSEDEPSPSVAELRRRRFRWSFDLEPSSI